jgi:hypothetical protein
VTQPRHVYIGYDESQAVAYHVLAHSIVRRASIPVAIVPVARHLVRSWYSRPREANASTDFSYTRFLTPWLHSQCGGWCVFMDCDMLMRSDIAELFRLADDKYRVLVRKHDEQTQGGPTKFRGNVQHVYPRKNWSSLMLMHAGRCYQPPKHVAQHGAPHMHRFGTMADAKIGALPVGWNHLVGVEAPNPDAKLVHYTLGGPWIAGFENCEFADEWRAERAHMTRSN